MFFIPIENTDPYLGLAVNGKRVVNVYDRALGGRRFVVTDETEADKFILQRNIAIDKAGKQGFKYGLIAMAICIITGALIGLSKGKVKFKELTKLSEEGNQLLKAGNKSWDLDTKFIHLGLDRESNTFKVPQSLIKENVKDGVSQGAILGCLSGLLPIFMADAADNKITTNFIEKNK